MIIDCISDLHGHYPLLDGGDLLIIAGDLTASDKHYQYVDFIKWVEKQKYSKKIVIAGNHDNILQKMSKSSNFIYCADYLCDSGTEFEYEENVEEEHKFKGMISYKVKRKLKIWGSPWSKTFPGMNPHCKAFTVDTEEELAEKFKLIPDDVDILITHSPPYGILDRINPSTQLEIDAMPHCGSVSLTANLSQRIKLPRLLVFGHIHGSYGQSEYFTAGINGDQKAICVNASHVNERYEPVNKPVRVIL